MHVGALLAGIDGITAQLEKHTEDVAGSVSHPSPSRHPWLACFVYRAMCTARVAYARSHSAVLAPRHTPAVAASRAVLQVKHVLSPVCSAESQLSASVLKPIGNGGLSHQQ